MSPLTSAAMSSKSSGVPLENWDATAFLPSVTLTHPVGNDAAAPSNVTGSLLDHNSTKDAGSPLCIASTALTKRGSICERKSSTSLIAHPSVSRHVADIAAKMNRPDGDVKIAGRCRPSPSVAWASAARLPDELPENGRAGRYTGPDGHGHTPSVNGRKQPGWAGFGTKRSWVQIPPPRPSLRAAREGGRSAISAGHRDRFGGRRTAWLQPVSESPGRPPRPGCCRRSEPPGAT